MILETEVWVSLSNKIIKYYEDKGYDIPRYRDSQYRWKVKRGTKILVKVEDLSESSDVKVTKICDEEDCGKHIPNISYYSILINRKNGDGKDRCFKCGCLKASRTKKDNVPYEKSLEFHANENDKKYLLQEFSDKNEKNPSEISYGTEDSYLWNCPDCKSEYGTSICNRTISGFNCPYCTGRRVNYTNCLWTTHPQVAKLLSDPKDGFKYSFGSGNKVGFTCPDCGFIRKKTLVDVVNQGFSCSRCGDGIKYPEKFMMEVLNQIDISYETQCKFDWPDNKKYDFYLPSLNCIIETHGEQHYGRGFEYLGGRTLEEEKENDEYKMQMAISNSISNYIVLNCRKSTMEFMKNSILNSRLTSLFTLDKIDWIKCHEFTMNSLVKTVCNLWNDRIGSTVEIGRVVKLDRTTVGRYLKQGVELGWCNYDPKEERKKWNNKKIVQLSLDGKYIKSWDSATEAGHELGISRAKIGNTCLGNQKTSGKFKWMYKEDYENVKLNVI